MKKIISILTGIAVILAMMPSTAFAETVPDTGYISPITEGGSVVEGSNNTQVTFGITDPVPWSPADSSIGRSVDGWWIGAKIYAPINCNPDKVTYQTGVGDGWSADKSFNQNKDSAEDAARHYIGVWGCINPEYLINAKRAETKLTYKWRFNWDGNTATGEDGFEAEYQMVIDPDDAKLYDSGNTNIIYPAAEEGSHSTAAIKGTLYDTLEAAVSAAGDGSTITLLKDVQLESPLVIANGKNLVIDLAGRTLSRTGGYALDVYGTLELKNGTVKMTGAKSGSAIWLNQTASLTIASDATVIAENSIESEPSFAVAFYSNCTEAELILNGNIKGENGVTINGNIKCTGNTIAVNDGAGIEVSGTGIYLAGNGTTTVSDAAVKGKTAVEIRAGELNITDGEFTADAAEFSCNPNGNGTTTSGAAVAVAQHTTKQNITVNISGGTFTGIKALNESNPQGNDPAPQVTMTVTGGTFNGDVSTADVNNFITGGTFSSNPLEYKAGGTEVYKYNDSRYVVAGSEPSGYIWTLKDGVYEGTPVISGGGGSVVPPAAQKPAVEAGEGADVVLSEDGTTASITVADGYELEDVVLNGVSLGKVTEVKNLKTGDKLVVTAAKKAVEEDIAASVKATSIRLNSKKGKGYVKLSWIVSGYEDLDGYDVYRGKSRTTLKRWGGNTKTVYRNAKGLKKGTTYYYKVRGYKIIDGKKVYTKWSNINYRKAI
ncbi:MAG: hypothetical protein SPI84_03005 [Anaerovoracaceae bacterium]|nr:hypothetical protein [Anaerovoracaceae bacterium]